MSDKQPSLSSAMSPSKLDSIGEASISCSQQENGFINSFSLFSEKAVDELLQSPVQGTDEHLIEFSEAMRTVAKALRRAAEGKASAQAEAAEWRRKYELERARNLQLEPKEQLPGQHGDDAIIENLINQNNKANGKFLTCCGRNGICSHEVLRDGEPDSDSKMVRKASFKLSWRCKGEQSDQHKHDIVSFERGNITTAERSSKQISLKWESRPQTVLVMTKPNSISVRILCAEMVRCGGRYTMEIEVASSFHRGGGGESSGGGGGEKVVWNGGAERGTYLAWEDLTVVLPNFGKNKPTKRLLHGLTGYAEPGRIMAIMGPSGSGKSTLLDSLAGRLSRNVVMTGNILFNGKKRSLDNGVVAYVTQEDVLLGTLTVRETLTYSAHLRLPTKMTKEELNGIVEGTIIEMGLQDCADRLIGNWHLRGLSGGEKKRLSIALEILTRPCLLCLDEPTSGLDSASAFFVVQTLRNIARDGRTIISSIHQPSSEVFALFDDLFLLSSGETVYFGEAKMAIEFFAEAGFPCPSRRNPSDHFLRCVNSDFDVVTATLKGSQRLHDVPTSSDSLMNLPTAEIKARLSEKYRWSTYAKRAKTRIREISTIEGIAFETERSSQASWWKQLLTLTRRSTVNMSRDVGYYWLRIIIYIAVSICVGTIYFDVGTGYTAILARGACGGFVTGFMTFMSIGGFPSFIEETKIFYRERLNGYYGVAVYILSNFLSSFPFLVAIAVSTGTITYYMVKFRPEFSHYVYYCLNIYACISVIESLMMVVASLVPNFLMGIITGAGIIGIFMMTSGFFRLLSDIPKPFWRYPVSYLSYGSWSLQGAYKNDLIGLEFDPLIPGGPKMKGKDVITKLYRMPVDHSKWWDLAALVVLIIFYRLLFFIILKFKERASPLCQTLYTKRVLHHLDKRPSFRKIPSFPSKRHQPLHTLSSQEGLNSPLH